MTPVQTHSSSLDYSVMCAIRDTLRKISTQLDEINQKLDKQTEQKKKTKRELPGKPQKDLSEQDVTKLLSVLSKSEKFVNLHI